MNKVILIGNLTKDVDLGETPSGVAVARFTVAVNRKFSNADGEKVADYFNIVVWRGQAENCAKYLNKGSKVAIVGELQNRSYEDKNGDRRTITEVQANEVEFLSAKTNQEKPSITDTDEDLPF